jgi:hypothetical protein
VEVACCEGDGVAELDLAADVGLAAAQPAQMKSAMLTEHTNVIGRD